jgi:AcrR family transcriptional regulator
LIGRRAKSAAPERRAGFQKSMSMLMFLVAPAAAGCNNMSALIILPMKTPPAKPPRSKRSANKEKTRRAILQAALALFARQGFQRTTTRAISRKAGIAEGTLFNYFRTKEDLALYFFEQELTGLIAWFKNNKRLQQASLPEQLFALIDRHLDGLRPYEDFIGAVYLRALQPSSRLSPLSLASQSQHLRYLQFIREVLARAEAAKEIPAVGDFGAIAFGLFHLAMVTYWLQDLSPGKENTLALLDRSLKAANGFLNRNQWDW